MGVRDFGFWLCGVLTGITLGVAGGVLFAPQSGRHTRRKLRRAAEDVQDRLEEAAEDVAGRGREFVDRRKKSMTDAAFEAVASRASAGE